MKIAVTAAGATLESPLDPRFGRCPYFLIVETEDLSFEAVSNPNASRDSGAGIQAAQLVADKGARFVLTGNPCLRNPNRCRSVLTWLSFGMGS